MDLYGAGGTDGFARHGISGHCRDKADKGVVSLLAGNRGGQRTALPGTDAGAVVVPAVRQGVFPGDIFIVFPQGKGHAVQRDRRVAVAHGCGKGGIRRQRDVYFAVVDSAAGAAAAVIRKIVRSSQVAVAVLRTGYGVGASVAVVGAYGLAAALGAGGGSQGGGGQAQDQNQSQQGRHEAAQGNSSRHRGIILLGKPGADACPQELVGTVYHRDRKKS